MTWSFLLPFDLASKNGVSRNPHARRKRRDMFATALIVHARALGIPTVTRPPGRGAALVGDIPHRYVTITRVMRKGQRPYDDDGLQAGDAVLLRDALQPTRWRYRKGVDTPVGQCPGAGVIVDDSAKQATFRYAQVRGETAGVLIEIRDQGDGI